MELLIYLISFFVFSFLVLQLYYKYEIRKKFWSRMAKRKTTYGITIFLAISTIVLTVCVIKYKQEDILLCLILIFISVLFFALFPSKFTTYALLKDVFVKEDK